MPEPIKVPIEHFMHVAEVVRRLTENGVPIRDLFVTVTDGELELRCVMTPAVMAFVAGRGFRRE